MGSDEMADWSAIFGETPKADAYTRQLEELRGRARAAEVAAQLAERKAANAEKALHANADLYAESLREYKAEEHKIALVARVMTVLTALLVVCTIANVVLQFMR